MGISQQPSIILKSFFFNESILVTSIAYKITSSFYWTVFFSPRGVEHAAFFVAEYSPFLAYKMVKMKKRKDLWKTSIAKVLDMDDVTIIEVFNI